MKWCSTTKPWVTGLCRAEAIFGHDKVDYLTLKDRSGWTHSPLIIWSVVWDVEPSVRKTGYKPKVNTQPGDLLVVLSDFFHLPLEHYHEVIITWMETNLADLGMAQEWWTARGQDWKYYKTVLQLGLTPDGLEV